jgi:hypothetical protein
VFLCVCVSVSVSVPVYVSVSVFVYVSVSPSASVSVSVCVALSLGRPQLTSRPPISSLRWEHPQSIHGVKLFEHFGHILFDVHVLFSGVP